MSPDAPTYKQPHWLSSLRSYLRILIIVLSGTVIVSLAHTLKVYKGNRYLDLRKGELPMTWPAHTNLVPTIVLMAIAGTNFLASIVIVGLGYKKAFRRPFRSRDVYRIVAGSFGVVLWTTALAVYFLLNRASKASLGRYACTHRNVISNGRYQYRAVCSEQARTSSPHCSASMLTLRQRFAFYVTIGATAAEALTLLTLWLSASFSKKQGPTPTAEEKHKRDDGVPIHYHKSGRLA
ncbi:hypothetical protein P154DRAFT_446831 [Amniculicola lignicola CBS 123094]|uniref:Uncharacterized protein n=1 Tax=Amniculicola lignicola CBS 123094 TaxID=1392246 RepID=A0A6A5W1F1_9PLEO|nr:hypothetical protein P154DRAFT_446831 [Amniculicola lignicola CBS 123094]